jgi:phage shock protein PspC (stress-responsive transcriptional regulator)
MWAGVAGGIAEYFNLDASLVRLLWVVATVVTHGLAVPVYIVAWIILPRDDQPRQVGQINQRQEEQWWHSERYTDWHPGHYHSKRSAGIVLVGLGLLLLAANTNVFGAIDWQVMWPLIFIGLGVILLARQWSH